jgi:hypothetical protein
MNENEEIIDSVLAEFHGVANPIQFDCRTKINRSLPEYKWIWESCAAEVVQTFTPSRMELLKILRGRIDLDRQMVLQTISRLVRENYAERLIAAGENEDMAKIVAEVSVSISVRL